MDRHTVGVATIIVALAAHCTTASPPPNAANGPAKPLTFVNPGFEDDFADPGCFNLLTPVGWQLYDPNAIFGGGDFIGVIDPTGTTNYPGGAPEGLNVALVFLDGEVGAGPMGLRQLLTDTLQPDTNYTLSVQVGDIDSGQGPPHATSLASSTCRDSLAIRCNYGPAPRLSLRTITNWPLFSMTANSP